MANLEVSVEPNSQNIHMIVTINAPLEKVFDAYTNVDLIPKWWAQGNELKVDYYSAEAGGKWRFVQREGDNEYGFHGCIHEVIPSKRLIQTFEFEGLPESGHVALERADFESAGESKTVIRMISTFQSVEDRDGMVASGMEQGFRGSIEALGRLIEVGNEND